MLLVTGATGNVGKLLVRQLVVQGQPVRALVRDERKAAALGDKVEIVTGDLDRPETLLPAMRGVRSLYIVTPQTHQVSNLIAAAQKAGVQHIVKQSTIEADRSLGPGKWHRQQEAMIAASGMDWTFLRPTLMMVNTIEWWSATIKTQGAVYFPGGSGRVSPVDPLDVAAAASAVLTRPGHAGQVYPLTGPQSLSMGEMVQILAQALGRPLRYVSIPPLAAAVYMLRSGLPFYVVRGLVQTLGALRRSEYAGVSPAVERLTGCPPRTFELWCRENIAAFQ